MEGKRLASLDKIESGYIVSLDYNTRQAYCLSGKKGESVLLWENGLTFGAAYEKFFGSLKFVEIEQLLQKKADDNGLRANFFVKNDEIGLMAVSFV